MSELTPNLHLPYLLPSQAQKHVTHNDSLRMLDALVQLTVRDHNRTAPPADPVKGDRHLVAESATGAWSGRDGQIAAFEDGGWSYYAPSPGWRAWSAATETHMVWTAAGWIDLLETRKEFQDVELVGINASADASNRLTVSAPATLFNHAGGSHRVAINKASSGDTGSVVLQTGFSARAEIGLTGSDDLQIKVSTDGSTWTEALRVAPGGGLSFPTSSVAEGPMFNLLQDGGRFAGSPEPVGLAASAYVAPNWMTAYNGAVFVSGGKFTNNNSTNGGVAAALPATVSDLINRIKASGTPRRFGPEFHLLQVTAGSGIVSPLVSAGVTRYSPFAMRSAALLPIASFGCHLRVVSGSIALAHVPGSAELFVDGAPATEDVILTDADGWRNAVFALFAEPSQYADYNTPLKLYATPGSEFLLGLPFLSPVRMRLRPGQLIGRVPSIFPWR